MHSGVLQSIVHNKRSFVSNFNYGVGFVAFNLHSFLLLVYFGHYLLG